MCGITGFLDPRGATSDEVLRARVRAMADRLVHRGPDSAGEWTDAAVGLALGHRRLSILDLSPEGAQPMRSSCGRVVVVFNGEIYNFRELRRELEAAGRRFRGTSDTEVLVEGLAEWGTRDAWPRFEGMFAAAAWDLARRRLVLARDPIGKKPLYWGWNRGVLAFASELKALQAHPGLVLEVDRDVVASYLRWSFVPSPYCILKGFRRVEPGSAVELTADGTRDAIASWRFWSQEDAALCGEAEPFAGSPDEAVEVLDELLADAVERRMVSDVPLGALLSGGIDSSTVVAVMQQRSPAKVQTFSIGFTEPGFNEAEHAAAIARHLGTDHHELTVTPQDALDVVPELPRIYDEPFADPSQIPTVLVCRLARREVTVALSGDGGDELLAGYNSYPRTLRRWRTVASIPTPLRRALAASLDRLGHATASLSARPTAWRRLAATIAHEGPVLRSASPLAVFVGRAERFHDPQRFVPGAADLPTHFTDPALQPPLAEPMHRLMYLDAMTFLAEDVLVKVDRASMASSLEVRCPLLDRRVAELAWRLPLAFKVRHGVRKWPLRAVLERYVPRSLWDRPKRGFSVPIAAWTRGPLRPWCESLLEPARVARDGLLDPTVVRDVWQRHLAGWQGHHHQVWTLLMLQAWWGEWRQAAPDRDTGARR